MRRHAAPLTLALAAAFSLPAQAESDDAVERLLDGGVVETLVGRALSGIDFDALIAGFEQSAQAAAEGRPVDPEQLARTREKLDRQMAQTGPALARDAAGVLGPVLRELRAELAREMATLGRD